jgi:predicted nucleotidyltransferase component of viral defense system
MMTLDQIRSFYPESIRGKATFAKYLLKEYIQLLILDHLSTSRHARKMTFIGGTNLRLVKGIDRFSEGLDFDCRDFSMDEFLSMSDDVMAFLRRNGLHVEPRDRRNDRLSAFRRNLHFPELLSDLGLSGHREERFMVKLEAQDQGVRYEPVLARISGCGLFFSFPVPPDGVLCAMKIAAMLGRGKGRDYYDVMFLLALSKPNYPFLAARCGIHNAAELRAAVRESLRSVDLKQKQRDFEHLLFNRDRSRRILSFPEFMRELWDE